jgi:hypothetical protein
MLICQVVRSIASRKGISVAKNHLDVNVDYIENFLRSIKKKCFSNHLVQRFEYSMGAFTKTKIRFFALLQNEDFFKN